MCSHDFFEYVGSRLKQYHNAFRIFAVVRCGYCGGEECYGTTEMKYTRSKFDKEVYPIFKKIPVVQVTKE